MSLSDGAELKAAGGADVIMHTSSSHAAVVNAMEGLRPWGKVIMSGIALDEMTLPALPLVSHSYQIVGSAHNSLEYLAEALDHVASGAVKPMIEVFPKERVADAYETGGLWCRAIQGCRDLLNDERMGQGDETP